MYPLMILKPCSFYLFLILFNARRSLYVLFHPSFLPLNYTTSLPLYDAFRNWIYSEEATILTTYLSAELKDSDLLKTCSIL